jgi:hypothetical protein
MGDKTVPFFIFLNEFLILCSILINLLFFVYFKFGTSEFKTNIFLKK